MIPERQFAAIYRKYSDQIWRYCYVRTKDPDLAEDMTQEIFTKAWRADAFADANHRAYLFKSAYNQLVDHWRRKKDVVSLDVTINEEGGTLAEIIEDTDAPSPQDQAVRRGEVRQVVGAIREIPKKLRDVVVLRFVNQLSVKETAEVLELSEGNVRVLQYRALKELKKVMK